MRRLRAILLNLATAACLLVVPGIAISHLEERDAYTWIQHANGVVITTSHATALILALLLPTARLINFLADTFRESRRDYRLTHYICLTCGYDLRATPDRCPECGGHPPGSRLLRAE